MKQRLMGLCVIGLFLLVGWYAITKPAAAVSTIVVTTTADSIADDGLCSLREAIIAANSNSAFHDCPAGSGNDTITFDPGLPDPAIFNLTLTGAGEDNTMSGDLDITGSAINTLNINGAGLNSTIIDGNGADRVLDIQPGARVSISGITIRYGNPGGSNKGGGANLRSTGRLTLNSSLVISNTAAAGGGIYVLGGLTVNNSTIQANSGGGVANEGGLLTFNNAHFLDNSGGYAVKNQQSGVLTFNGGDVMNNSSGGILNENGTAHLSNLQIIGNLNGGGVHSQGSSKTTLTLTNSAVMSNTATSGGGVLSEGIQSSATIENSRFSFNEAVSGGGGIVNNAVMTVKTSTIDNNQARSGGGIDNAGPTLTLTNVTIHANSATDNGGGLHNRKSASFTNVTISGNSSGTGGNIFNDGDTAAMSLFNTIIAQPGLGSNCLNNIGVITSLGHNLDSEDSCGLGAAGDQVNTDPLLGPLQNNGGSTFTRALLAGSPAIDQGSNSGCPAIDQRGISRPQGPACDIGAFEFALTADLSAGKQRLGAGSISSGQAVTYTITITNAGPTTPITATVVDTWSPASAVIAASAPGCAVDLAAGTATCQVTNLGLGSTVVTSPYLVLTTSGSFAGTLTNVAQVYPDDGIIDPTPGNNTSPIVAVDVIAPPFFGVDLSPDDAKNGVAGQSVIYTLQITNTGNVADTFDLSVTGNTWTTTLSTPAISLAAGANSSLSVTVDIPPGALGNDGDVAIVTATSLGNPAMSDSAILAAAGNVWMDGLAGPNITLGPGAGGPITVIVNIPIDALGYQSDTAVISATSLGNNAVSDSAMLTTMVEPVYGVNLSPGDTLAGMAGKTVTYTLAISNSGNVADTFNLAVTGNTWTTTLSSPTLALAAGASGTFTATVAIPPGALGNESDMATITATSQGDPAKSDTAQLTTTVLPAYGLFLSPDDSLAGLPGKTVTYTLIISNSGNVADTFDLAVTGNTWTTNLSSPTIALAAGASGTFSVSVAIPPGALTTDADAALVTATSSGDPAKSDTAQLTTTVLPAYGLVLSPDDSLAGLPGKTVTYTLTISNSGNMADTFDLAVTGNTWTANLSSPTIALAAGASGIFTVTVAIPPGALTTDIDTASVTATSSSDPAKSGNAMLTTTVMASYGLILSPDQAKQGPAGQSIIYTLWITNTGNVTDTFNLEALGNVWVTEIVSPTVVVPAGARNSVQVQVTIPADALGYESDSATVAAASSGNPLVSDTAQLVTTVAPFYGVALSPDASRSAAPGTVVTYTLTITNTGNMADIFDLAITGQTWTTTLSTSQVNLAPLTSTIFTVRVTVPPGAADQEMDAVTIKATSQHDVNKSDTAVLTTVSSGRLTRIYLPVIVTNQLK